MSTATPQIQIAKPTKSGGINGVLPVPPSSIQQDSSKGGPRKSPSNKVVGPRLKVVIRRLPPGLTRKEFDSALGDDWKVGTGRVDWMVYKPGKASHDPAKPSRPSRAYLHLTDQAHLATLSEKVHQTSIQDAKNTANSPSLLGPPSVEFAPYGKVPSAKRRNDARQGTIDQDPEFVAFLESLTNPIAKPSAAEGSNEESTKKGDAITITPLIKFLKEKKASKGKDALSATKGGKQARSEAKGTRGDKSVEKKSSAKAPKILSSSGRGKLKDQKSDEATQKAVQALNKEASTLSKKGKAGSSATAASGTNTNGAPSAPKAPTSEKKRERGNASAAARMLQRDLGLGPGAGGRRGGARKNAAEAEKDGPDSTKASASRTGTAPSIDVVGDAGTPSVPSRADRAKPPKERRPKKNANTENLSPTANLSKDALPGPAGPTTIMKKPKQPPQAQSETTKGEDTQSERAKPTPGTSAAKGAQKAAAPSTGTQAFVKHANPSQGITEDLLQNTMETFGTVVKVEIDKRKGFAYVDFVSPEGLQKAVQASPVEIAQGQVTVLERKHKPSTAQGSGAGKGGRPDKGKVGASSGGGRGGRGRGKGAGAGGRGGSPNTQARPETETSKPADASGPAS